jgi:hypothetical protein
MKRLLILAAMAFGLTTTAMSDSAEAGRWRGSYRGGYYGGGYYPGHYYGGYYGGYRPYRSYYYGGYNRPYRSYYGGYGWGGRRGGYVATPWFGARW